MFRRASGGWLPSGLLRFFLLRLWLHGHTGGRIASHASGARLGNDGNPSGRLIYLNKALDEHRQRCRAEGRELGRDDVREAVMEGAVLRVRPKIMTVVAIMAGLLPIMWGMGIGSEVMRRIAAPMVGGVVSATVLTLIVIPAIYASLAEVRLERQHAGAKEKS